MRVDREHLNGDGETDCWCEPVRYTACECDDHDDGCEQCQGGEWMGLLPWNGQPDDRMVVMHRDWIYAGGHQG